MIDEFKKLEESCKKLEEIQNYTNNRLNAFELIVPIIDAFNTIKNMNDDKLLYDSMCLIINIKEEKPQLKGIVDAIIEIINESYKEKTIRR